MSQTAIGKAALVLTTDATQLKGGLTDAMQFVGGKVAGGIASVASGAKGVLTSAGTAIGTMVGGPIGGMIGRAVGAGIGDLGVTIAGALTAPLEKLNQFGRVVKDATTLGIDPSQYQGITKVFQRAGIEGGQVNQTLTVMAKLVNDAANGYGNGFGKADAAFVQLGLSAKALAAMAPDEQFKTIATALTEVKNKSEQAAIAAHIFGGRAAELLPELQKGGAGIQEFIDQQKRFGAVLSTEQLTAAANAAKAWKQAKNTIAAAWDGLVNRATVIAAPIVEWAGKAVQKVFAFIAPVFDWLGRGLNQVADIVTAVFGKLEEWTNDAVEWFREMTAGVSLFGGSWPTVEQVVVGVFRAMGTAVAYVWDTLKAGAGVAAIAFGAVLQYGGSVVSMFRAIVDLGRDLPDALKPAGFDGFADAVVRADDKVRGWGKDIKEWGKEALGSFGESAAKFNSWLDRALVKKPKEAAAAAAEAVAAAVTTANAELKKFDNHALAKGSSAEVSARLTYEMGGKTDLQLAEAKKANAILADIKAAVENFAVPAAESLLPI